MTQNTVDYSGDPSGAALMDNYLVKEQQNRLTGDSGTSRPSYAQSGSRWIDTTTNPWNLYLFDGTSDVLLGTVNISTHQYTPANVAAAASAITYDNTGTGLTATNVQNAINQVVALPGNTIASQSEAEGGSENTKRMTALRVRQAINILLGSVSQIAAGTAGYIVGTVNFKTFVETYQARKVYSATVSSGSFIPITSVFRNGYNYRIKVTNLTVNSTSNATAQFSNDNGATFKNGSSDYTYTGERGSSVLAINANATASGIAILGDTVATGTPIDLEFFMEDPAKTGGKPTRARGCGQSSISGAAYHSTAYGEYIGTGASTFVCNAVRIAVGGTITGGQVTVWEEPTS